MIKKKYFNWKAYLRNNPDLKDHWDSKNKAYLHYILFGILEKRVNSDRLFYNEDKRLSRNNLSIFENYCENSNINSDFIINYDSNLKNNIVSINDVGLFYKSQDYILLATSNNKMVNLSNKFISFIIRSDVFNQAIFSRNYENILNTFMEMNQEEIYETINEQCFLASDTITYYWGHMFEDIYNFVYTYLKNDLKCKFVLLDVKTNQLEFVKNFIPEDKIIVLKRDKKYFFKDLIFCKPYHGFYEEYNKQSLIYLNEILYKKLPKLDKYYDKIFIVKNQTNSHLGQGVFKNIGILSNELKKKGYFILDPQKYSLNYIISLMQKCKVLVAQWGSSLYHMVYMNPNSICISLCHNSYRDQYLGKNILFYNLSNFFKINFNTIENLEDNLNIDSILKELEDRKKFEGWKI